MKQEEATREMSFKCLHFQERGLGRRLTPEPLLAYNHINNCHGREWTRGGVDCGADALGVGSLTQGLRLPRTSDRIQGGYELRREKNGILFPQLLIENLHLL